MSFITSLEPHVLIYILTSISEGLTAVGKNYLHLDKERIRVFRYLGFSKQHSHLRLKNEYEVTIFEHLAFEHFKNVTILVNGAQFF